MKTGPIGGGLAGLVGSAFGRALAPVAGCRDDDSQPLLTTDFDGQPLHRPAARQLVVKAEALLPSSRIGAGALGSGLPARFPDPPTDAATAEAVQRTLAARVHIPVGPVPEPATVAGLDLSYPDGSAASGEVTAAAVVVEVTTGAGVQQFATGRVPRRAGAAAR